MHRLPRSRGEAVSVKRPSRTGTATPVTPGAGAVSPRAMGRRCSGRLGRHGLGTHDLAELLDRTAQGVHLVVERGQLARGRGARRRAPRGTLARLELVVATTQQSRRVELLGDVAAEQLAGLDVD